MDLEPVTHVIFDLDGLLLDSEKIYIEVYKKVAARYGKEYTEDLVIEVMGTTFLDSSNIIVYGLELPITPEDFMNQCEELLESLLPETPLMPGAKRLIEHLHANNIPMALGTSSHPDGYHKKIDKHHSELFSLLGHKILGTSHPGVEKGKPFPDIFLVAAAEFPDKPNPEQCLVFEDSLNGVRAAISAGMQVVMVPDKNLDRSLTYEATLVLDSLEEFEPELFGLPKFNETLNTSSNILDGE